MLSRYARAWVNRVLQPLAAALVRRRISPDMVTIIGTGGAAGFALTLYPTGHLFWGSLLIAICVSSDLLDGALARQLGRQSPWGAFLDSTLDRVGDSALFMGLSIWFFTGGAQPALAVASLACLVLSTLVSYVKARAEALGAHADTGIMQRFERLVVCLLATGLVGLGLSSTVLLVALCALAAASAFTVVQRVVAVYRQLACGAKADQ